MNNVTATVTGGPHQLRRGHFGTATTKLRNSSITGTTFSLRGDGSSRVNVAGTMLDGALTGTGFTCVGSYTASYVERDTDCSSP